MIETVSIADVKDILESISSKLKGKVREAYVFGSVVEGTAVAGESDLDILIIPKPHYDYFKLLDQEIERLLDLGIVLHIHIASNITYERMVEEVRAVGLRLV